MTVKRPLALYTGASLEELRSGDTMSPDLIYAPRNQTLRWSNGGQGNIGSLTSVTAMSFRMAMVLPVATTRWRLLLSNYDTFAATSKTAMTLKKLIYGDHSRTVTSPGAESGDFVGSAATDLVTTDQTIPGDGTQYATPWVSTAGADQFSPNVEKLIGIGITCSSQTVQYSAGRCWRWTNSTSATTAATAASGATSTQSYVPLDVILEYDTTSSLPAVWYFGDSISEGVTAPRAAALAPTSIIRSPVNQWSRNNGILVQNHSLYSLRADTLENWSRREVTRQPTTGATFDAAVIALGTNDVANSRSLAQVQTSIMSIVDDIRTAIGTDKPIYLANVPAHGQSAPIETVRLTVNDWYAQLPYGVRGTCDIDRTLRSTSGGNTSDTTMMASDGVHPCFQGQAGLAAMLRSSIGLPFRG